MSSTLSPGGPSRSAKHGGPSGCAQPPAEQENQNLNALIGGVANEAWSTAAQPTNSDRDAEPVQPIKAGVPAATTKKKCREQRAAEPDALTVDEAVKRGPAGKGKLYQEIAAGRLIARKMGRRTIILRTDYERWLNGLPTIAGAVPARHADALKTPSGVPPRRRGRPRKTAQQSAMASSSTSTSENCGHFADERSK